MWEIIHKKVYKVHGRSEKPKILSKTGLTGVDQVAVGTVSLRQPFVTGLNFSVCFETGTRHFEHSF